MLSWVMLFAAVLATAPVRLSLRVDISREPSFAAAARVYGVLLRLDGPLRPDEIVTQDDSLKLSLKEPMRFLYFLFQNAQWLDASAVCRVGTGDACQSALAAGAIGALLRAAGSRVNMRVSVLPEFEQPFFALSVRCILFLHGGDIIRAGARVLLGRRPMKRKVEIADGQASH